MTVECHKPIANAHSEILVHILNKPIKLEVIFEVKYPAKGTTKHPEIVIDQKSISALAPGDSVSKLILILPTF